MRICVIGVGHVGLVTVATMAADGHEVVGLDTDAAKVESLRGGVVPWHEPGLQELVDAGVAAGRISYTTDFAAALHGAEVAFICVGTPAMPDGSPNLSYVQAAAAAVATHATQPVVVAEKSTVPVRTGERIRQALALEAAAAGRGFVHDVVSNPEFLKEGSAVEDTLRPDRVVVGADSDRAHDVMRRLYTPLLERHSCPYVATDVKTAELIKHASNAFLATKISFINAIARICELAGADVEMVADAMGFDARIGRAFLNAGIGYGGSCFPKDVDAFIHIAQELGYDFSLLRETERINREARQWPLQQLRRLLWNLLDKQVAVLGVAFKPGTDDIRESPALNVVDELVAAGARVRLHDPVALDQVRGRWGEQVELVDKAEEALRDAHAVVVCTDWDEYKALPADRLRELLAYPVVIDGRNIWDPAGLREAGLTAARVGNPLPPTIVT